MGDDDDEQVEDERSKYGPIPVSDKAQVDFIQSYFIST